MTSNIDICNRALSEVISRSSIQAFDDGSVEGYQCGLWYDNMRQRLLRTAPWAFARMQVVLTQLGDAVPDNTAPYPFGYAYAYPAQALAVRYILPPPPPIYTGPNSAPNVGTPLVGPMFPAPSRASRFIIMNSLNPANGAFTKLLCSNIWGATGVFTGDITDPNQFDPLFEGALTSALASKLVGPLSGNVGMKRDYEAAAEIAIAKARVADGNEAIVTTDHTPDWIRERGIGDRAGPALGWWGLNGQWWGGYENMNWGS